MTPSFRVLSRPFVRHIAAEALWLPWRSAATANGFEARDVGIATATAGLATVRVARSTEASNQESRVDISHQGELLFLFVLEGALELDGELSADRRDIDQLRSGDSCVIPAGVACTLRAREGSSLLEVAL